MESSEYLFSVEEGEAGQRIDRWLSSRTQFTRSSLQKLLEKKGDIRTILPCHHDCPIAPGYIEKNLEDAISLRERRLKGKKHPVLPCVSFKGKWTEFYCDM